MLLQPSSVRLHHVSLSSDPSFFSNLPIKPPHFTLIKAPEFQKVSISCTNPRFHNNPISDNDGRPKTKWRYIYDKICRMEKPELGVANVLNELEKGGEQLEHWMLTRVAKQLRLFRRFKQALEVYEWRMSNKDKGYRLYASDAAVQLDLIARVRGITRAEEFFNELPDAFKGKKTYSSLLNAYVRARMEDKAESLMETMRENGYAVSSLPFNTMMTLYRIFKKYDKVESIVEEMKQKRISLDLYSYNTWLASQGSEEKMERVYREMTADQNVILNWVTYCTIAVWYIKMGSTEKAKVSLRKLESAIFERNPEPYNYLMNLYATIGAREEVYSAWKVYKSSFLKVPNRGYQTMIASLIRVGDLDGAEKIFGEWELVKTSYNTRIANLLMVAYVKEGNVDKAESLFNRMIDEGGKPNPNSWETLAEGHVKEKRLIEALSCFKEAFAFQNLQGWKPKPDSVLAFFDLCDEEADTASKEVLVGLLRQSGFLKSKDYASLIGLSDEVSTDSNDISEDKSDGYEVFLGLPHDST